MRLRKLILLLLLSLTSYMGYGQQEALFSHYLVNPLVLNPAVAGSEGALSVLLLHRSQWLGFEGAPTTQTFTLHGPFGGKDGDFKKFGAGLHIVNDNIGPNHSLGTYGSASYRLIVAGGTLGIGIRGGLRQYGTKWATINYNDDTEPYTNNVNSMFIPNFDFGLHYYTNKWFFGTAVTNLSQPKLSISDIGSKINGHLYRHLIAHGGYDFELSESLMFKPSIMVRYVAGSPFDFDLNANFILQEKLWLGMGWRLGYGAVFTAQYELTEKWKFGYSYDASLNKLRSSVGGSHEVFLGYVFRKKPPEIPLDTAEKVNLIAVEIPEQHQIVDEAMIQEPVEEVAEEPVDEVADEPVDEIAEEPVDEVAEEPVEEVVEEPVEEIAEEPVEEGVEEVVEEPVEEVVEEVVEEPVEEGVKEEDQEDIINEQLVAEEEVIEAEPGAKKESITVDEGIVLMEEELEPSFAPPDEVIISAILQADEKYDYIILPFSAAKVYLINDKFEILQTGIPNEMGFMTFKNTSPEDDHLFKLEADNVENIHRLLAFLVDNEKQEVMVFAPKVNNNIYKYEALKEDEPVLHVISNSGDTLMTSTPGVENEFRFDHIPESDDYTIVLESLEPEEYMDVKIDFGFTESISIVLEDHKVPAAVIIPKLLEADILEVDIVEDQIMVEPSFEVISEDEELVTVIYTNERGEKEKMTFTRNEIDFKDATGKFDETDKDAEQIYAVNIDGDTLGNAAKNADGLFVFDNLPQDAELSFQLDEKMSDVGRQDKTKEVKVLVQGEPIKKAVRTEEGNLMLQELSKDEIMNLIIIEDIYEIPVFDRMERNIIKKAYNNIEFDLNSDALKWSSFETINELASILQENPDWILILGGHADAIGEDMVNLILSRKRVESVKRKLVSRGANADQIQLKYFGEKYPIANNSTEEGRTKNRRVEMVIVKKR